MALTKADNSFLDELLERGKTANRSINTPYNRGVIHGMMFAIRTRYPYAMQLADTKPGKVFGELEYILEKMRDAAIEETR